MDKVTIELKNQRAVVEELKIEYGIWVHERGKWAGWRRLHPDDADPRLVDLAARSVVILVDHAAKVTA